MMARLSRRLFQAGFWVGLLISQPAWALDLASAYELALQSDPQWQSRLQTYLADQQTEALAAAALKPTFGLNAAVTRVHQSPRGYPITIDSTNTQIGVQGRFPLLDATAFANWQQARLINSLGDAQLVRDQQQFILNLANRYFALLRAQDTLDLLQREEKTLARQQDAINQRYLAGLIARTDILDSAAQYQAATANRVAAEAQVASAREQLVAQVGQPVTQIAPLRSTVNATFLSRLKSMDAWLDQAARLNPDVVIAQFNQQVADQGRRVQASARLPQVALTGGYSRTSQSVVIPGQIGGGQGYQIGAEFNWPFYQGGRISAGERQAAFQAQAAQSQVAAAQRQAIAQVRANYLNLQADAARLVARAQAVDTANRVAEAAQVSYQIGTRNIVDVLLAQRTAYAAQRDLLNTRYDHVLNYLNLQAAVGELDGTTIRQVNQLLQAQAQPVSNISSITSLPRQVIPPPQVTPAEAQRLLREAGNVPPINRTTRR